LPLAVSPDSANLRAARRFVILPAICYAEIVSRTLAEPAAARTGYLDKLFLVTVVRLLQEAAPFLKHDVQSA
jgi:hypothetical protein